MYLFWINGFVFCPLAWPLAYGVSFGAAFGVPFFVPFGESFVYFRVDLGAHFGVHFGGQFSVHFGVPFWSTLMECTVRTVWTENHQNVLTETNMYLFLIKSKVFQNST